MRVVSKLKLAAGIFAMLALALTFNACGDSGDEGGGNQELSGVIYPIMNITNSSYTVGKYHCDESAGKLEIVPDDGDGYDDPIVHYSISNKVLTFPECQNRDWYDDDGYTFKYNGNSNKLIGTIWTSDNKKRNAVPHNKNCSSTTGSEKLEFTENALIGYDFYYFCISDEIIEGQGASGFKFLMLNNSWKDKSIDCNSYEISNGTEKVKVSFKLNYNTNIPWDAMVTELTYNGKTCTVTMVENVEGWPDYLEKMCKKAYETSEDYRDIKYAPRRESWEKYRECLEDNNFPGKF